MTKSGCNGEIRERRGKGMAEGKEPLILAPAKRPIFRGMDHIK